jgi:phosphate transport system substrate-binding protein
MRERHRARRSRTPAVFAASFALWLGLGAVAATPAMAYPTLVGAGSTWVQIALDQWRSDIAQQGFNINYQGVGSSSGRAFFIGGQVDFAASEIPFQPDEVAVLRGNGTSYQYLPDVAGGTSFMYNLHDAAGNRITNLKLSANTIAKIFTGGITNWNDPAITADNGVALPSQPVLPVYRSDGSGTSAQLSFYLAHEAPAVWNAFLQAHGGYTTPTSEWPPLANGVAARGSDGVANYVADDNIGRGSITYVEYGYAAQRNFPVASVRNASGNYTQPTSANVATALAHATLNSDETQNLGAVYTAPEPTAYPVSSYSYMITRTSGFDPQKGFVLGTWLIYIACAGQQEAPLLGYSPLPPNLVQVVFGQIKKIPGAPTPPPLSECDNPTITNPGQSPSPTPAPGESPAPGQSPAPGEVPGSGGGDTPGSGGGDTPGSGGGDTPGSGGGDVPGATGPGGLGSTPGGPSGATGTDGGSVAAPGGLGSAPLPGVTGPDGTVTSVSIYAQGVQLTADQFQQNMLAASEQVKGVRAAARSPLFWWAIAVFALIFVPVYLKRRLGRAK